MNVSELLDTLVAITEAVFDMCSMLSSPSLKNCEIGLSKSHTPRKDSDFIPHIFDHIHVIYKRFSTSGSVGGQVAS